MQQIRIISVICSAAIVLSLVTSCSDSPENKASKSLANDVQSAMESMLSTEKAEVSQTDVTPAQYIDSHIAARAKIQRSIQANRQAPDLSFAYLASGNLASEQADFMRMELYKQSKPIDSIVSDLSEKISRQKVLSLQQSRMNGILDSYNKQADTLKKIIAEGNGDLKAVETQIVEIKKHLEDLKSRRNDQLDKAISAQTKGNDLQTQADELLKLAETSNPDEKLGLTKKAYDLLLSKKQYYIDYQNAQDMADSLAGEIAIIEPLFTKLNTDLSDIQQKITSIENSPEKVKIQTELDSLAAEIAKNNQKIQWLVGEFKNNHTKYSESYNSIITVLEEAGSDYKKIRNRSMSSEAGFQLSEALSLAGKVSSEAANLFHSLFIRMDILQSTQQSPPDYLDELRTTCETAYKDFSARGLEKYSLAAEEYEKIAGGSSGNDIKESYLLTLYGQMMLAELTGDFDTADKALLKAEEIIKASNESDPAFSKTIAARLFAGTGNLTPQLKVDNTAYYESVRKQFQGWKSLKGKQAENEVNALLSELERMQNSPDTDPELMKFLQPDWNELKAAKEKGFEASPGGGPGDPNSIF